MAKAKSKREVKYKWRFAIGTTSRVPHSKLHYVIADFDGDTAYVKMLALTCIILAVGHQFEVQKTKHGFHVYSNWKAQFASVLTLLDYCGADKSWLTIGSERGYLFLADKDEVQMSWPVERMALRWDESAAKKARHRT